MDSAYEKPVIDFLEGEISEADAERLAQYLGSNKADRKEFLSLADQARVLEVMFGPEPDICSSVMEEIHAKKDSETFVRSVIRRVSRKKYRSGIPWAAAAACAVLAAGIFLYVFLTKQEQIPSWNMSGTFERLETAGPGYRRIRAKEKTALKGPYGSIIRLSGGSVAEIPAQGAEPAEARTIELVTGSAYVDVHAASEDGEAVPFILHTQAADCIVKGTEFFVEIKPAERRKEMKLTGKVMAMVMLFTGALQIVNDQGSIDMLSGDVVLAEEGNAPQAAVQGLAARFGRHYKPVTVDVKPVIPQYKLPLKKEDVGNYEYVRSRLPRRFSEEILAANGFFGTEWNRQEDYVKTYEMIRKAEIPVYVTSDSVLHLYHIHFDETLKRIEQKEFIPKLSALSKTIIDYLLKERVLLQKEAPRDPDFVAGIDKAIAFYAVGYEMLNDCSGEIKALTAYKSKVAKNRNWSRWQLERLKGENEALYHSITGLLGSRVEAPKGRWNKRVMLSVLDRVMRYKKRLQKTLTLPAHIRAWVDRAKQKMAEHKGFAGTQIFTWEQDLSQSENKWFQEDFSQYVPRGHYTRGYDLKRYFKAMMWFGRMTFLIKGGRPYGRFEDYLVPPEEAKRQTIAACYLTRAIRDLEVESEPAIDIWERIYGVTSFFVGLADDLTYTEYDLAFTSVLGKGYTPGLLSHDKRFFKVKTELAKLRKPAIYSGTGASGTMAPKAIWGGEPSPEELDKVLAKTQGFRFMGQRFVPDSYVMGKLVFPTVGAYSGSRNRNEVFTCVGGSRYFPRGLDVMGLLGSKRARDILKTTEDSAYKGYDKTFGKLAEEFTEISDPEGWNINLYWSWLYCLKGLLSEYGSGYQAYMQTDAWLDKELNASLGSWAQLRHDTILYAKQSYTMEKGRMPRRPKDFPGYVEPVPEFYGRLLALNRLTEKVLSEMKVLDNDTRKNLNTTDALLSRLVEISTKELKNKALTEEDEKWIKFFDQSLKNACCGYGTNAMKTTLIADVHTDQNSQKVLEEGTGYINLIVVANHLPDGSIGLAAGPVFSYYEFKHPMADRLTDEKWRSMLGQGKDQLKAKRPEFIKSYFRGF